MNTYSRWLTGLAVCGSAALAFGLAQAAPPPTSAPATAPAAAQQSTPATQHAKPATKRNNPFCVRDTGSLIKPPPGQCLPVNGRSYSRQELDRTGAVNIGQALQMLDPSVSVGH